MKKTLTVAISGLLLASAMGYASADATTAPAPTAAPVTTAAPAPAKKLGLFAALAIAKVSLDDAIKTAEQAVPGKLVSAVLGNDSNPNTYRIGIADSSKRTVTYVGVDSSTGKVLTTKVENRAPNAANKAKHPPAAGAAKPATAKPATTTTKP